MKPLSDNDMLQIYRYLTDDLTPGERSEFEAELEKNTALKEALAFEENLLQLGDSAGEKIKKYYIAEEENKDKEVADMIKQARENWKKEDLAHGGRIVSGTKNQTSLKRPANKTGRAVWKRLAIAATVAGIALTILLYVLKMKNEAQVVVRNEKTNVPEMIDPADTKSVKKTAAPENIAKEDKDKIKPVEKNSNRYKINNKQVQELFADNFSPDAVPGIIPDPLLEPLAYYESGQYKDALAAFENMDPNFTTRSSVTDKKQVRFYTHYYKSLSYLAANNAAKAIPELQKAIQESPNEFLAVKARWYQVLAHLKMGNLAKTEELLNELADNQLAGKYRKRALKLKELLLK